MDGRRPLEGRAPEDVREEIRFYLEERTRELMEQGLDREAAWAAAVEAFGDVGRIEAEVVAIDERRRRKTMGEGRGAVVTRDLRYAIRGLIRNPGFTIVAVLTLALGLGANTAMYGLVHAALFRPPPVEAPEELVAVYTTSRRGFPRSATSYPDYLDYADQASLLEGLAATSTLPASLSSGGTDDRGARFLSLQAVTGNYFEILGVDASSGRTLTPDDDTLGAGTPVLVISHDLWQNHFLGDPSVVGSSVRLNGSPFTVVGIARPEFTGLRLDFAPDAWIPMQAAGVLGVGAISRPDIWETRQSRWMGMLVGRMTPGTTVEQVRAEFTRISDGLKATWAEARGPRNTTVDPLASFALPTGSEDDLRRFVLLLLSVVGFTLLLACANLANLLLARGSARTREIAIRLSMGASRAGLVRQLLIESLLLSATGALLGSGLALALLAGLGRFELPGGVAIGSLGAGLDASVLGFTAALALGAAVLFGLVPALQATRPDLVAALKGEARGGARRSEQLRSGLVSAQVALCLVLLIGSGLFVNTMRAGLTAELGFESEGIALARYNVGLLEYGAMEGAAFADALRARLGSLPGVTAVGVSTRVPLQNGGARGFFVEVDGYDPAEGEEMRIDFVSVSPGYFKSLGLPILAGRAIESADGGDDPVVVISRSMADAYWHEGRALGGRISIGGEPVTVIGVAEDVTWVGLADEATHYVFYPLQDDTDSAAGFVTVSVRATGDPADMLGTLQSEIRALEADAPITMLTTMDAQVRTVLMPQEMGAVLLTGFGLLALALAAIGIAGVVTYTVARRRRDIGVRMALGAAQASVLVHVVRSVLIPVLAGVAVGVVAALMLGRTVEGFLFGVEATDPTTYLRITAGLLVVSIVASALPARHATKVDPVEVLKAE